MKHGLGAAFSSKDDELKEAREENLKLKAEVERLRRELETAEEEISQWVEVSSGGGCC